MTNSVTIISSIEDVGTYGELIGYFRNHNNMYMRRLIIILLLSIFFINSFAQKFSKNKYLTDLSISKEDTNRLEIYEGLILLYKYDNIDSAQYYLIKGRALAEKLNSERGIAMMYVSDGEIKHAHSDYTGARQSDVKALEMYYHLNYPLGISTAYNALGVIEAKLGNYKQATSYFLRSLMINEKINNKLGVIQNNISLGVINMKVQNFKKSFSYLDHAINLAHDSSTRTFLDACNNLGSLFALQGDLRKALYYFEMALEHSAEVQNPPLKVVIMTNIANAYSNLNEPKKAMQFYNEALSLCKRYHLPEEEARAIYNIGVMYEYSDPNKAIQYFEEALVYAKNMHLKQFCVEIYESIYVVKRDMKDFEGACDAFEEFHIYSDSITKLNNKAEIELVQSTFDLEKSNAKINKLELTAQKKELQEELTWILIVGILSFLFVIGIALYKRNKYNIQLLRSIQVRDKLLSIIAHDLRSPINNVLMILLELENNQLREEDKGTLFDVLKKQTEMSLVTLENILSWGQVQLRSIKVNQEVFNLNEVIQNNISSVEVSLKNKEINIETSVDPNIELYTDMNQFDFVVRNLLSNAIKFSNYRSTISIVAETINNTDIKLSIIDHGVGISEDNLVLLFGVNQKINVGTAKEKGSGLGLLLCKEFVEANQGEIGVVSKLNDGSTFYFTSKIAGKA